MNRQPLTSSNIKSAGYENGVLEIEFTSGVYAYKNVPPEAYAGLLAAKSAGGYFAAQIRGKFESAKVVKDEKKAEA